VLSQLATSCSPAPGSPSQQYFNSSSNCQKKELLNQQSWEEGQLPLLHAAPGHPCGRPAPWPPPFLPCSCDARDVPVPAVQKTLPVSSGWLAHTSLPNAAAPYALPFLPQTEVLLWWSTECPARAANFPGFPWFIKPSAFPDRGKQAPQLCFAICLTFSLPPMQYPPNIVLYQKSFLSN